MPNVENDAPAHEHEWEVEYLPDPMSAGGVVRSGDLACSCGATREDRVIPPGTGDTPMTHTAENDACVCPTDICLGVPGESDACGACLVLDPEASCLHDPEVYVIPPGKSGADE